MDGRAPMNTVWRILGAIAGAVFVYAGAIKAMEPIRFATDIDNYHILPWAIGVRLAFYLPWLEILCGLAVIVRVWFSGALSTLSAMTAVFIVASVIAKARGLDVTCGCFGHAGKNLPFATHLLIDFALLAVFVSLIFRAQKISAVSP